MMLGELGERRLEVGLTKPDYHRGGDSCRVRTVFNSSPSWYRAFCKQYTARRSKPRNRRKHDTLIKRAATVRALEGMLEGFFISTYAERLQDFIGRYYGRKQIRRGIRPDAS